MDYEAANRRGILKSVRNADISSFDLYVQMNGEIIDLFVEDKTISLEDLDSSLNAAVRRQSFRDYKGLLDINDVERVYAEDLIRPCCLAYGIDKGLISGGFLDDNGRLYRDPRKDVSNFLDQYFMMDLIEYFRERLLNPDLPDWETTGQYSLF